MEFFAFLVVCGLVLIWGGLLLQALKGSPSLFARPHRAYKPDNSPTFTENNIGISAGPEIAAEPPGNAPTECSQPAADCSSPSGSCDSSTQL